ncbi:MAG TPA: hypothetical protein RMH99_06405, partial [Sandaracinaceae bacterium LLY-WYZ-13_1]|nr:hypothetical protein [Sandaracinaceae bacterium LLY-WYZ-13_1]
DRYLGVCRLIVAFAFLALGRPGATRASPGQWLVVLAVVAALGVNTTHGRAVARHFAHTRRDAQRMAARGEPSAEIVAAHPEILGLEGREALATAFLDMYRGVATRRFPRDYVFEKPPSEFTMTDGRLQLACRGRVVRSAPTPDTIRFPGPRGLARLRASFGTCDPTTAARFSIRTGPDETEILSAETSQGFEVHVLAAVDGEVTLHAASTSAGPAEVYWSDVDWASVPDSRLPDGTLSIASAFPITHVTCERARGLFVHAPAEVRLRVPPGPHRVAITYGLCAEALARGTDGVVLELIEPGAERPLARATLTPEDTRARGLERRLEASFDRRTPTPVRLHARPGGTSDFDWTYLRSVEIEPR